MEKAGDRRVKRVRDGIINMPQNLLKTRLFWAVLFTLFLSVSPKLEELEKRSFTVRDWIQVLTALASSGLVLLDCSEMGKLYTPRFLPGKNKEDFPQD